MFPLSVELNRLTTFIEWCLEEEQLEDVQGEDVFYDCEQTLIPEISSGTKAERVSN